jgi:hypothetical protein
MMLRSLTILAAIALLVACEVPIDVELPHTERLVIDGFIGLEHSSAELRILRTLPPLAKIDIAKMTVSDAAAAIEWNGVSYPLVRNDDSITFALPTESSTWHDGVARLVVTGLGKTATSTTRIPRRPVVVGTTVVDSTSDFGFPTTFVFIDVEVDTGSVIWSTDQQVQWSSNRRPLSNYGFKDVVHGTGSSPRTRLRMIGYGIESFALPDSVTITVFSADPLYDRYLRSPYGGSDGLFGFSGTNPFFNIDGEGIGLFIGVSSTTVTVKLK